MRTLMELSLLASDAVPTSDEDWGSERQIEAENKFFDAVREVLSDRDWNALEDYCLKATTEEMLTEALDLVRPHFIAFGDPCLVAEQQRLARTWGQ